jgi:hypothetical protein
MRTIFDIVERHWGMPPVPILAIIRDAGIIYSEEPLPDDCSGFVEQKGGLYRIATNSAHSPLRRRFTAAHELGHFVYHRDLMDGGVGDNKMYRSSPGSPYYNPRIQPKHERQANQFAATVLMPQHLIRALQRRGLDIPAMARSLEVSEDALRIRLGAEPKRESRPLRPADRPLGL